MIEDMKNLCLRTGKFGYLHILLRFLSVDEAYVMKRHLMDGADWPRIAKEYCAELGEETDKNIRTFMAYQQRALRKIVKVSSERVSFPWHDIGE